MIRSWNIRKGVMNFDKVSFTDELTYNERIRRAKPASGDIVITREAPMGEVAMIAAGLKCCLGQRLVLLRPNEKKIDGHFLLYSLQSKYVQHQILSNEGTGSTVSNLRIPDLKRLKIPVRKLDEQRKIASLFSSIDDKIELNRQTNKTLEKIAEAIFQEWFVDFKFPGLTGEQNVGRTAPRSRSGKLRDILKIEMGQSPDGLSYNQVNEGVIFFQGKAEFGFRFPTIDKYTTEPKRFAEKFDTLLSVRAPVGMFRKFVEYQRRLILCCVD